MNLATIRSRINQLNQDEHYDGPWKNSFDYAAYTVKTDMREEAESENFWNNFRGKIVDGGLEEWYDCQAEFTNP